jgi:hypothetical protein
MKIQSPMAYGERESVWWTGCHFSNARSGAPLAPLVISASKRGEDGVHPPDISTRATLRHGGPHRLTVSHRRSEVYTGCCLDLLLQRLSTGRGKAAWIVDR